MLWLALYFPDLPLELFSGGESQDLPPDIGKILGRIYFLL